MNHNFGIDAERRCHLHMFEGKITWSNLCFHHLKGKSLPMQHEEAWRDDGHNWAEVRTAPSQGTATSTPEAPK